MTGAVEAFAQGVLDYLVQPVGRTTCRNGRTPQGTAGGRAAASNTDGCCTSSRNSSRVFKGFPSAAPLIQAQVGQTLRLISVDEIDYLRADTKYTRVAWRETPENRARR